MRDKGIASDGTSFRGLRPKNLLRLPAHF